MAYPNIQYDETKQVLTITVPCSKRDLEAAQPSKTGKSKIVSSTNGFTSVGPVRVSLNVITN